MHSNSSRWPLLRNGALFCLSLGILLVVGSSVASAGFSITIYVDGDPLPTIFDDSLQDLNDDDFNMTVPFTVGDVGNNWNERFSTQSPVWTVRLED